MTYQLLLRTQRLWWKPSHTLSPRLNDALRHEIQAVIRWMMEKLEACYSAALESRGNDFEEMRRKKQMFLTDELIQADVRPSIFAIS
jgi:hypothetical protein